MSTPKKSSQYERKLARQRQLELMEAAASGVAPAMELDTSSLASSPGRASSSASSLRSRSSDRSQRYHQEEEEEVHFTTSPVRSNKQASMGSLFEQRGRPDGFPVNTGLNLMDHETGIYKEQSKTEQFLAQLRGVFGGKRQKESSPEIGDYLDYHRSSGKQRQASSTSFTKSLWVNKKRRYSLMLLLGIGIFIVAMTGISSQGQADKALRQQNTKRFNSIMDSIVHEGVSPAGVFLDSASPEHHALRWVAYSDPVRLDLDDPMLITRYALAVFFYNSFLTFEKEAGRQKPIEDGVHQWEGVPNPGWIRKDYWLTEKGVCTWYGVHCAALEEKDPTTGSTTRYDANEPVTAIQIRSNNIMGTLPAEFKALEELYLLDLMDNELSGMFPSHVGRLFRLEYLHLNNNRMTGSLTYDIGFLESIKTLDLRHNSFSGQIPSELNRLYNLELLQLSENKFTGSIPRLNDLQKLENIQLDHNELDKPFPFTLAMQSSLKELHLNNNKIVGSVPDEIGSVRKLEKLRLDFNRLDGPIPRSALTHLSNLIEFNIDGNAFTGSLPSNMSAMTKLTLLSAAENKLTGTLPHSMGHLSTLEKLHLNQNDLSSNFPSSFGNLTSIKELWLEGNRIKGHIPASVGNCTRLETLLLNDNQLTGRVPKSVGKLVRMKTFRIQENEIIGDMPSEVCFLKNYYQLSFLSADCEDKVNCDEGCCNECF